MRGAYFLISCPLHPLGVRNKRTNSRKLYLTVMMKLLEPRKLCNQNPKHNAVDVYHTSIHDLGPPGAAPSQVLAASDGAGESTAINTAADILAVSVGAFRANADADLATQNESFL